ncbi:DUF2334 domain-containing protein [Aquabacterium soli]|uniref:DUF2334 domain-containing protein n=1 Tax=Aquabacterium soli TaxID=2493092 RepID=A0A426VBL3_9BURK|nr:DUF2334 domain-containing protein [Aquabacterium soli]RRS04347.1 DUF2334 domain-containing protein [Aquabacterium soli]
MSARYILRFDDVAPGMAWSRFLPLKQFIEEQGVRCLLGVVPCCRDASLFVEPERADFFDLVRLWQSFGDTVAQHGAFHVYETAQAGVLGINSRSEFSGLSLEQQLRKLGEGKAILQREQVWQPYFMPPSHSFDRDTVRALKSTGFVAITDGMGFFPYALDDFRLVPQLLSRPLAFPFGVITICVHVNAMSDHEVERLRRFVTKHRSSFVSFKEIVQEPINDGPSQAFLRWITSHALKAVRAGRRVMSKDVLGQVD